MLIRSGRFMFLSRLYDRLILGLAVLGALSLAFITIAIVVDVILRNTGFRPFQATSAIVEYVLLFSTMAGSPWLVRIGGHIAIVSFVECLPHAARQRAGQAVAILSIIALGLLCWRSAAVGWQLADTVDMRSINMPMWVLYSMLSVGFGLMATEFLKLLLRGEVYDVGTEAGH